MRTKTLLLCLLVVTLTLTHGFAQRQFFDLGQDFLLANFDLRPDEDDVHAAAALACMLKHPDLAGVDYHAVAGAYGQQGGSYITAATPGLYNTLFGPKNQFWSDRDGEQTATENRVRDLIANVLLSGNQVFVQEAGQSDFTFDVLQKVINETSVTLLTVQNNVIVVQHSWLPPNLDFNERQADQNKLNWVKNNTDYVQVANGNVANNGSPQYKNNSSTWLNQAKSSNNPNAQARTFWTDADAVCDNFNSSFENPTISGGGIDYSDCVEIWWIFDIGNDANTVQKFWDRYVINTPAPTGCNLPYTSNGVTIEQQTVNWTTGSIDISCVSSVDISLQASGVGAMENADFLNIYYKVNGGSQVAILENVNTYPQQTLTVNNLSGNSLEILVNAFTSFTGEVYTVNNIVVSESSGGGNVSVTGVSVSPTSVSLTSAGATANLFETVSPSNATNQNVSWSSNNTSVATVNSNGVVTAVANGNATITVTTADGGFTATSAVSVSIPSGGCDVPFSSNGVTIEQQTVNWTTGVLDITCASSVEISLQASGVGSMENADFLNIYYKVNGGAQIAILENVNTYPQQTLTVDNISGNTLEILVDAFTSFTGEIYTVNNISVTESNGGGNVSVTGVNVSPATVTLTSAGATANLSASVSPSNATNQNVSWSSNNPSVATVNGSGLVTAVANGSVTITATTADGGFTDNSAVTVSIGGGGNPQTVTLSPIHDAYTQNGSGNNNNLIRVENSNRVRIGYLQYDLSGISGTINSAELKMSCNSDAGNGGLSISVAQGNSNNWTESNISSANAPSSSGNLATLQGPFSPGTTYTWNLSTSSLSGGGNLSLIVTASGNNDDVAFASKENSATEPQLVITYTPSGARRAETNLNESASSISVYPNPVDLNRVFHLSLGELEGEKQIAIFDMAGRLVYEHATLESQFSLKASRVFEAQGVYLIRLLSSEGHQTEKILVK